MEDINKNAGNGQNPEIQPLDQTTSQKEAPKSASFKQKIAVTKNILKRKKTPGPSQLTKGATDDSLSISSEAGVAKETKTTVRKATKAPAETSEAVSLKKLKPENETPLQNEAQTDQTTKSTGKLKTKKRKVKKAEKKVDKLKIKVKKAKKKDAKPGKLKALKDKLNKAIEKFKIRVKKLKKAKK